MNNTADLQLQARLTREGFTLDLDLALPGQGITAMFGASGSGKTTALRVLAGLEPGAVGRVCVKGEVWQDSAQGLFKPVHQRALGYVFQEASLFEHLNVQGNLQYGFKRTPAAQRSQSWDNTLDLLGISHLLKRWPHELSGGERQRVAIARALATSPRLLLLDEPLAALDAPRKAEILPYLERLQTRLRLPVIYVTHAIDEVILLADHLVLLDAGRVTAFGPTAELLTRLDLLPAHGDTAAALVEARVCEGSPADHLCVLDFSGGQLVLPQTRAIPLPADTRMRMRIQARDVSLSLVKPEQTSVLNILPATVVDLMEDGPGQVLVGLQIGSESHSTRILSRISQLSARRLRIAPGARVYAQIKGVAMVR